MIKSPPYKPYIEILPAAMLAKRQAWQADVPTLSANGCLLITNPANESQTRLMVKLARSFRQRGKRVVIWSGLHSTTTGPAPQV